MNISVQFYSRKGLSNISDVSLDFKLPTDTQTVNLGPECLVNRTDGVCYVINRDCTSVENSVFRTISGACNNLVNQTTKNWGSVERTLQRRTPAEYGDSYFVLFSTRGNFSTTNHYINVSGVFSLRTSKTSKPLPSPRNASRTLVNISRITHNSRDRLDDTNSMFLFQAGQFVAHDLSFSPRFAGKNIHSFLTLRNIFGVRLL